jgi:hypothetical protein
MRHGLGAMLSGQLYWTVSQSRSTSILTTRSILRHIANIAISRAVEASDHVSLSFVGLRLAFHFNEGICIDPKCIS